MTVQNIASRGWTLSVFLLVSYLICIGFGLLALQTARMQKAWVPLLPGFDWLAWPGFLAGAAGSFLHGWYIAVLTAPPHAYFQPSADS